NQLYHSDFQRRLAGFDSLDVIQETYRKTAHWDLLSRMMYLDTTTWLPNDILIKADRMSMAASIELRPPFLDHRLAEYAASIPSRYKLRLGKTKYILKRAFRHLVPREILRRPKMGFPVPIEKMSRAALRPFIEESVQTILETRESSNESFFNRGFVGRMLQQH